MSGEQWLPVVTAVVTLLVTWFKETTQRRGAEHVQQRLLTQVKEEIGITEAWAKAHASLGSGAEPPAAVRERAQRDLDNSYDRLQRAGQDVRRPFTFGAVLSRILLLDLPVKTGWVRALRLVYYLSLVMAYLWGQFGLGQQSSWANATSIGSSLTAYFILAVVPAWSLHWFTRFVAKKQAARMAVQVPPQHNHQPSSSYGPASGRQPAANQPQGRSGL
jgi:hypothetical protein